MKKTAVVTGMTGQDGPYLAKLLLEKGYRVFGVIKRYSNPNFDNLQFLGIEDLRFHDLRHEGVSRLFEIGYNVPHAAAVSGHRSWTSLKRYTHLRQTGDKFADWSWIAEVTTRDPRQRKRSPARPGPTAKIRMKRVRRSG